MKIASGLRHVSDDEPGLSRRRRGRGFSYVQADGTVVSDPDLRARIAAIAVPPAWRDVWICADADGHIQATGFDEAGRKQYRYHPDWQEWRSRVKFDQLVLFGGALPRLRRRVARDLEAPPGSQEFALAALILLLDCARLRIGSSRHTKRSGTFGATTLLQKHVRIGRRGRVELRFRAKGGTRVERRIHDQRLHRALEQIADLPGAQLFTWIDAQGVSHPLSSQMVNSYLSEASGLSEVTAKTFRTWSGTVAALGALRQTTPAATVKALCERAAEVLHNTPAICRSSYIHPLLFDLVELAPESRLERLGATAPRDPRGLRADERRLLHLLTSQT